MGVSLMMTVRKSVDAPVTIRTPVYRRLYWNVSKTCMKLDFLRGYDSHLYLQEFEHYTIGKVYNAKKGMLILRKELALIIFLYVKKNYQDCTNEKNILDLRNSILSRKS